jgi:lysyl endopeptidase
MTVRNLPIAFAFGLLSFFAQSQSPTQAHFPAVQLPALDVAQLLAEDRTMLYDIRCAAPIPSHYSLDNQQDNWTSLPDGSREWQLTLQAPDAHGLTFLLQDFHLPKGSLLTVENSDASQILHFSESDNNQKRILTIGMIYGNTAKITYFEPKSAFAKGRFDIFRIYQAYKKHHLPPFTATPSQERGGERAGFGFGTSLDCNVNINCAGTDSVKNIKRGVTRVMMVLKEGIGYCTGNLLNNTDQDGKPYVLTGFHCQDGYTPMYDFWKFDFHYEAAFCSTPIKEPIAKRITGCVKRSGWRNTDFLLLELTSMIPDSLNLYFNGWDRTSSPPVGKTYCVHHASGDIKKFSSDETGVTSIFPSPIQWNNTVTTPANHHFKMKPTRGIFEVGSSGCGLFNQQKRLVGNFNGGDFEQCNVTGAYFGRLSLSWDGGGSPDTDLKHWLDPKNKGDMFLDGIEKPYNNVIVKVSCKNPANKLLGHAAFISMETAEGITLVDSILVASGEFEYRLPTYVEFFTVHPWLDLKPKDGITTSDIVAIQRHVLGTAPFAEPWKIIAADANNNGAVTTGDIVDLKKLILGLTTELPKSESWRFEVKYAPPTAIKRKGEGTLLVGNPGIYSIEFQGVKIGDVNRGY